MGKGKTGLSDKESADAVRFARQRLGFEPDAVQTRLLRCATKRGLLNCTRQWGKSTVTAVLALHFAATHDESTVVVASPSARQSGEFLRKVRGFARRMGERAPGDGDNAISVILANGARVVGLPGKEDTVRGFFYREWSKGEGWARFEVKGWDCPRFSKSFLEQERGWMEDRVFRQEYECAFTEEEGRMSFWIGMDVGKEQDRTVLAFGLREPKRDETGLLSAASENSYSLGADLIFWETPFIAVRIVNDGPARGLWQFRESAVGAAAGCAIDECPV